MSSTSASSSSTASSTIEPMLDEKTLFRERKRNVLSDAFSSSNDPDIEQDEVNKILTKVISPNDLKGIEDFRSTNNHISHFGLKQTELSQFLTHTKAKDSIFFNGLKHSKIKNDVVTISNNLFKYKGFEPTTCRLKVELKEPDESIFYQEMTCFTALILNRGVKFDKIFKRTGEEGKAVAQFLSQKYNYTKGNNKGSDNMTFARHSHVFPDFCAFVIAKNTGVRILGDIPTGFPKYLCFPGSMALVSSESKAVYFDMYVEWNISFSRVIKSNQNREVIAKFAELSYNSPLFDNNGRKDFLAKLAGIKAT
jgi:hypothetical protein